MAAGDLMENCGPPRGREPLQGLKRTPGLDKRQWGWSALVLVKNHAGLIHSAGYPSASRATNGRSKPGIARTLAWAESFTIERLALLPEHYPDRPLPELHELFAARPAAARRLISRK